MSPEAIARVLENHTEWLRDPTQGARANLADANLCAVDLCDANLNGANLIGADLTRANLTHAYLRGANLRGANLNDADLIGANLIGANLARANLNGANMSHAYLIGADLRGADLRGADLADAYLIGAKGIVPLPVAEPRPYRWLAVSANDGWRIAANCHWYTLVEARAHWLDPKYDGPDSVKQTVGSALDWLEQQPLPEEI